MTPARTRKQRPALNQVKLQELALHYVERFATTRAKLRDYLRRKLRERGWTGDCEPDLAGIADEFARLGYVDDAAYALNQSRALAGRGYGKRRLDQKLRVAGVAEPDGEAARTHADEEAVASALRFAERRRLGPFASQPRTDPREREKALAAMIRAGHAFDLAKAIIGLAPGAEVDPDELRERARLT